VSIDAFSIGTFASLVIDVYDCGAYLERGLVKMTYTGLTAAEDRSPTPKALTPKSTEPNLFCIYFFS
jgi:hypothetical protein